MKVEVERVSGFNLRNLLGYDVPQQIIDHHINCIRRSSIIWLCKADGVEACAIGLIPATLFSTEPYLWMISTRLCAQHPLRFMRWSRKVMDEILGLYPSVIGLCHCDNVGGHRWLAWLGAVFDFDHPSDNGHYGFRISRWQQQ